MNFMDDATDKKAEARRTIILLYVLMAVGIFLPVALWWLRR
jgi:heme/copper-type cytochrome/quinol oxidase subunit 2